MSHPSPSLIDKHRASIDASPDEVWAALGAAMRRLTSAGLTALIAPARARAKSDPLVVGASIPGFTVTEATRPARVVLSGRHRFAAYSLAFTVLDRGPGSGSRLIAATYAQFPGVAGRLYRAAVVDSGAHRIVMRRLLRRICADVRQRRMP